MGGTEQSAETEEEGEELYTSGNDIQDFDVMDDNEPPLQ